MRNDPKVSSPKDPRDDAGSGPDGPAAAAAAGPRTPQVDALALLDRLPGLVHDLKARLGEAIVGQHDIIHHLLIALLAHGHAQIVGVPGLAKTLLVRTLAEAVGLRFGRVQCTPDMMPADITGSDLIQVDPETGRRSLEFAPGPVFTHLLLADELNRATPRTQAALLEAMAERQVTTSGRTRRLDAPFIVIATQNPIEQEGTYPLPEAQLDRFMLSLWMDYPERREERRVLAEAEERRRRRWQERVRTGDAEHAAHPDPTGFAEREAASAAPVLLTAAEMIAVRGAIGRLPLADHVVDAVLDLIRATRPGDPKCLADPIGRWIAWGASPRAGEDLLLAARCAAAMRGRPTPSVDDVRALAIPVLRHRIVLSYAGLTEGLDAADVVQRVVDLVLRGETD